VKGIVTVDFDYVIIGFTAAVAAGG